MEIYLIRQGQADEANATDPYTAPLTADGKAQARLLAQQCQEWGIQLLCVSTMLPAQQTADAVTELMPHLPRWDLEELEDITVDDLLGEPAAGQLVSTWTRDQLSLGRERAWIRTMAAWARIELYATSCVLANIAIIAHKTIIGLLLLNWVGLDWRAAESLDLSFDPGASCKVSVDNDGSIRIGWMNRVGHQRNSMAQGV